MQTITDQLLKAMLQTAGRRTFSEEDLLRIIGTSEKLRAAYQLCTGEKMQNIIAKEARVDSGNFSRTLARWEEAGIIFRLEDNKELKPLHIYPLSKESMKKAKAKKSNKK